MLAASSPADGSVAGTRAPAATEVIACHDCGLVHRLPSMADRTTAFCPRCGATLQRRVDATVDRALGCYLAALILFQVANSTRS
jgi:paraquat-inducible protein A